MNWSDKKIWLLLIIAFAFLARLAGINYGLPLWLVGDEPPFTLAALKMIQLKTLLPVLHQEDFKPFLYYPPYLSYLYLLPFTIVIGAQYLFFKGGMDLFTHYVASDTSPYFLIARFINIFLGAVSVWLIYRVAKNIFRREAPALLSAFFLATSLLHQALSMTGRHWTPVSFVVLLSMFFLTQPEWSFKKRYFLSMATVGAGMGVSAIVSLFAIFIISWYFFYEKRKFRDLFREPVLFWAVLIFAVLAVLPVILYPASLGFRPDLTAGNPKTLWGLLSSPALFLKPIFSAEPFLVAFAAVGLIFSFKRWRGFFWPAAFFIIAYGAAFYVFFRYGHRFILGVLPVLGLLAGYGFAELYQKLNSRILSSVLAAVLFLPLAASVWLAVLGYRNDSRAQAIRWAEERIPAGAKVLVYANLTRLPSLPAAIAEQRSIDQKSIRKVDEAEARFEINPHGYKSFHALNLYTVSNPDFYANFQDYARRRGYQYLITATRDFLNNPKQLGQVLTLTKNAKMLKSFGENQDDFSIAESTLNKNPLRLFRLRSLGPEVKIYAL